MSVSRTSYCERLNSLKDAINNFALHDLPLLPANELHNKSVRIIRNGLAVQCFNIFEDFLKARVVELLTDLCASGINFNHLPDKFKSAVTIDVIKAIIFQIKFKQAADKLLYVQQECMKVHSTTTGVFDLSSIGFFHQSSNIHKEAYKDCLAAFLINNPWQQVSGIMARAGLSAVGSDLVYENFSQRRHRAAHNANANILETDLYQSIKDAYGLAIAFDMLITTACKYYTNLVTHIPHGTNAVTAHTTIALRFIRMRGGFYGELKEGAPRIYRRAATLAAIENDAIQRTRRQNGALVYFDTNGYPFKWVM